MGFFDLSINKKLDSNKKEIIEKLKKNFSPLSDESTLEKDTLTFKNFKAKKTLLTYDLCIEIESSKNSISLNIFGELLNVWILVVLILLGILFTYGFGVIILVLFVYFQKLTATKYINKILEDF